MLNLLDLDRQGLEKFFEDLGEKPAQGARLFKSIHQQGVTDFSSVSYLNKRLREELPQLAQVNPPKLLSEQKSSDGTIKWLLGLSDNNCIETVFIPEAKRGTLCVSSQVGCALNCSFCATARQGFSRNLTVAEIIGQVWFASQQGDLNISNVVMMGMGEPLLNFDHVVTAMRIMMDDFAYGLSKYRVTLSTAGVVPALRRLGTTTNVALAVSLHAPNDELRNQLVPINKKYPLHELMSACKEYYQNDKRRKITIEYVMLSGINDSETHAHEMAELLREIPSKINLIYFNPTPGIDYQCSDKAVINRFREILQHAGYVTTLRKTRGQDIAAACGQLVGRVQKKPRKTDDATQLKMDFKHLPGDDSQRMRINATD